MPWITRNGERVFTFNPRPHARNSINREAAERRLAFYKRYAGYRRGRYNSAVNALLAGIERDREEALAMGQVEYAIQLTIGKAKLIKRKLKVP